MSKKAVRLVGANVYLRKLKMSDCNSNYLSWLNNTAVNQYLETRHNKQSIKKIKFYVSEINKSKNSYLFAICLKENNFHIGNIKVGPINFYHKYCDLSYFIGKEKYWSKGYASDAIDTILKFSFDELEVVNILAGVYSKNIGSQKVLERNGFKLSGKYKNLFLDSSNLRTTSFRYIISAEHFYKQKKKLLL